MTLCKKSSSCSWRERWANTNQVAKLVPSQFSVTIPSNLPIGSVNYTYETMTHPPVTNLAYNPHEYFHNIYLLTMALNGKPGNVCPWPMAQLSSRLSSAMTLNSGVTLGSHNLHRNSLISAYKRHVTTCLHFLF